MTEKEEEKPLLDESVALDVSPQFYCSDLHSSNNKRTIDFVTKSCQLIVAVFAVTFDSKEGKYSKMSHCDYRYLV